MLRFHYPEPLFGLKMGFSPGPLAGFGLLARATSQAEPGQNHGPFRKGGDGRKFGPQVLKTSPRRCGPFRWQDSPANTDKLARPDLVGDSDDEASEVMMVRKSLLVFGLAPLFWGCGNSGGTILSGSSGNPSGSGQTRNQTTQVVTIQVDGSSLEAAKNQLLLVISEDATQAQFDTIQALITQLRGRITGEASDSATFELEFPDGADLNAAIAALEAQDGVDEVTVNLVLDADNTGQPVDPVPANFNGNYWVDHIGARVGWGCFNVTVPSPRIGVVDGGFDFDQNAIREDRIVAVVDSENRPLPGRNNDLDSKHGTIVSAFAAGDASGANPSTVGVCWNSPLYEVKALGGPQAGFLFDGVKGVETALNQGCRWITVSLGPPAPKNPTSEQDFYGPEEQFRSGFTNILELAAQKDAVVCFATGNDGEGANGNFRPKRDNRFIPATSQDSDRPWRTHAMVIGATNSTRAMAEFSREGQVLTLAAPGEQIGFGRNIVSELHDGCSYATPLTAGTGAALMNVNPDLMAVEARQLIIDTASNTITQQVGNLRLLHFGNAATRAAALRSIARSPELTFNLPSGQNAQGQVEVTAPASGGPFTLSADTLGDSQAFVSFTPPEFTNVPAGETRTFQLNLTRPNRQSNRALTYPFMIWGRVNGEVVKRVPIRVTIPEES